MVYYKLILNDKRETVDQVYSIVVRITYRKTNTTFNTGVRVHVTGWDEKQRLIKSIVPNYLDLNSKITSFYLRLQKSVLKLEEEGGFSLERLREAFTNNILPSKQSRSPSFGQFVEQVISEFQESNKAGNALIYQTAWNRVSKFAGSDKLKFTDINYTFLEGFKRQLSIDGVKVNTISNYFRTLRAIYNRGIKAKLVDRSHYPFLDVAIKAREQGLDLVFVDEEKFFDNAMLQIRGDLVNGQGPFDGAFYIEFQLSPVLIHDYSFNFTDHTESMGYGFLLNTMNFGNEIVNHFLKDTGKQERLMWYDDKAQTIQELADYINEVLAEPTLKPAWFSKLPSTSDMGSYFTMLGIALIVALYFVLKAIYKVVNLAYRPFKYIGAILNMPIRSSKS
jgi:hypothetical protein